jgi:FG-GAP-like repeat
MPVKTGTLLLRTGLTLVLLIFILVQARIATAFPHEPKGFGKAQLGMTIDRVKKALPQIKPSKLPPEGGPALLAIYKAENQSVLGLKPCRVDFFFDPERLYQITFNCGRGVEVVAALQKQFGEPTTISPAGAFWQGKQTTVTLNVKARTFAFVDRALNQDVQNRLLAYVMTHQGQTGTPAAGDETPPAASPLPTVPPLKFSEERLPAGGSTPFGVTLTDLNGDGRLDMAVSLAVGEYVPLLLGTGPGKFAPPPLPAPGPSIGEGAARGITAADFNKDGHQDLAVVQVQTNSVWVLLNDGHGGWKRKQYETGLAPFNLAVADINKDGILDIVVANETNIPALEGKGQVSVLLGDGKGGFTRTPMLLGGSYPADVRLADFNGDGNVDAAVVNWKSADVSLFLGHGDGTFGAPTYTPYEGAPAYTLAAGDLNGDGRPDLVVGDVLGGVHVMSNNGSGSFTLVPPLAAGSGLRCLILADVNGDAALDIVTASTAVDTVSVLLAQPGGGFAAAQQVPVGDQPRVVAAADVTGDGNLDLVVTNGGSHDISVLINHGADAK